MPKRGTAGHWLDLFEKWSFYQNSLIFQESRATSPDRCSEEIENARRHNWFRHGSGPPTRIPRRLQTLATRAVDLGLCNPAIPELRRYITFAVSDCINAVSTLLYHLLYRRWLVALGVGRWFAVFAAVFAAVSAVSAAVSAVSSCITVSTVSY